MATGDITVGDRVTVAQPKCGDRVTVAHLMVRGKLIEESGVVVDTMQEPLERIKVEFEGSSRYPRPLWISPRLLRQLERGTGE